MDRLEKEKGKRAVWIDEQLKQWHFREQKYLADPDLVTNHRDLNQQRLCIQQEMLQVLKSFFARSISLREFSVVSQQRFHETWDIWHLKGGSGGLFLNKLVKYIPEEETLGLLLRMMLRVPTGQQDGLRHMQGFIYFLEEVITSQKATRSQLQPARVPLFLSTWWHMQEVEQWPIFYSPLRRILLSEEDMTLPLQNPVEAYFAFRMRFLELKRALSISTWELEQLILWYQTHCASSGCTGILSSSERSLSISGQLPDGEGSESLGSIRTIKDNLDRRWNMAQGKKKENEDYTYIQWLLAKIGLKIGCSVWISSDAHEKVCNGERLGDLSMPFLPILADSAFEQVVKQIGVLWLHKNELTAAYEVGCTTVNVPKSLLRLSDLAVLFPKNDVQLCVVTPQSCYEQIQQELLHPIFQHHGLHKRSRVIMQESLLQHGEHVLRWASGPSVIRDLALHLGVKEQ